MYSSLKKLYSEFSRQEKRRLLVLAVVLITTSLVQVVGIASIFPFISAASDPASISENQFLGALQAVLNVDDTSTFLTILGFIALSTLILTNLFLGFSLWLSTKFLAVIVHSLTHKMFNRYLAETYSFHLERNSSELIKNLTVEVRRVVYGGVMSVINAASNLFTVFCILVLLMLVDPIVALMVLMILGSAYAILFWIVRVKLAWVGTDVSLLFSYRMRFFNEALNGIKELKVLGRENLYLERFNGVSEKLIDYNVYSVSVAELPRFLIEIIAFGGIISITIFFIAVRGDTQSVLPIIALYSYAGYRMLPALQNRFSKSSYFKA